MLTVEQQQTVNGAVARLAQLNATISDLEQERDGLKTFIRLTLGPGTHIAGELRVAIIARKIFDPSRAAKAIPPNLLPMVTTPKIDPDKCKTTLPLDIYSQCLKDTQAQVRLT